MSRPITSRAPRPWCRPPPRRSRTRTADWSAPGRGGDGVALVLGGARAANRGGRRPGWRESSAARAGDLFRPGAALAEAIWKNGSFKADHTSFSGAAWCLRSISTSLELTCRNSSSSPSSRWVAATLEGARRATGAEAARVGMAARPAAAAGTRGAATPYRRTTSAASTTTTRAGRRGARKPRLRRASSHRAGDGKYQGW